MNLRSWSAGLLLLLFASAGWGADDEPAERPLPQEAPLIATAIGEVRITPLGDEATQAEARAALPGLVARAGGLSGAWTLQRGLLVGWSLRQAETIVTTAGVLRREPPAPGPDLVSIRRQTLADALTAAAAAIDARLPPLAAESVRHLLQRTMTTSPSDDQELRPTGLDDSEEFPESQIPRLLASPWLDLAIAPEAAAALRQAVAEAREPLLTQAWSDGACRLERWQDALGSPATWWWRTPVSCRYAIPAPGLRYHPHAPLRLVVDLPAGADPWRDARQAVAAALYHGDHLVAAWDGQRLAVDQADWDAVLAPAEPDAQPPAPHLVLAGPDGAVLRLVTRRGVLDAPADAGEDGDGFLDRAARLLDDPGELTLLGDSFLAYTPDSPDPEFPAMIGQAAHPGDLHQEPRAILATTLGGRFRGDCDDLAELYAEILTRQGRLAHVMRLSDHAAAGWLRQTAEDWCMQVFHSGPARRFVRPTGDVAVTDAYAALNPPSEHARLPGMILVLLRFAGENTRSTWHLGWRIFRDRDYARTMIAVQRDWHYRAYHHAIVAMKELVASGDEDVASLHELASLHRRIGDWPGALEWHQREIARSQGREDPAQALSRIGYLAAADEGGSLSAAVVEFEGQVLAPLARTDPVGAVNLTLDLLNRLDQTKDRWSAHVIRRWLDPWFREMTPVIVHWLAGSYTPGTWGRDYSGSAWRRAGWEIMAQRAKTWIGAGRSVTASAVASLAWWSQQVMPLADRDPPDPLLAVIGPAWWMQRRLGSATAAALVAAASPPAEAWSAGLDARWADDAQLASRCTVSPWWWQWELHRLAGQTADAEREPHLRQVMERVDLAERWVVDHALETPYQAETFADLRLIGALLLGDLERFDAALVTVARRNDRERTVRTATLIGEWSGLVGGQRFPAMLACWHRRILAPTYALEIAWRALLNREWDAASDAITAVRRHHPTAELLIGECAAIERLIASRRYERPDLAPVRPRLDDVPGP